MTIVDTCFLIDLMKGDSGAEQIALENKQLKTTAISSAEFLTGAKRSNKKTLWPLYWSNTVCSHPFQGEKIEEATERRLKEELGLKTRLKYVFKFQYKARFGEIGVENEICYVFMGIGDGHIRPNKNEVAEWKYIDLETLNNDIAMQSNKYTPWFKLEWERIQKEGYIKIIRS